MKQLLFSLAVIVVLLAACAAPAAVGPTEGPTVTVATQTPWIVTATPLPQPTNTPLPTVAPCADMQYFGSITVGYIPSIDPLYYKNIPVAVATKCTAFTAQWKNGPVVSAQISLDGTFTTSCFLTVTNKKGTSVYGCSIKVVGGQFNGVYVNANDKTELLCLAVSNKDYYGDCEF